MKATVCLLLLALGCAIAQQTASPSPNVTAAVGASISPSAVKGASPSPLAETVEAPPAVVEESPAPLEEDLTIPEPSPSPEEIAVEEPSPSLEDVVSEEPAPAPAATTASPAAAATLPVATTTAANTTAANITDNRVQAYYSSPLFAIQQTPELAGLAGLANGSEAAKLLSNKTFVGTIFAPSNAAVEAAVAFINNATNFTVEELTAAGVTDQLLQYHVTPGAALLLSRMTDGQKLTMLDGHKTEITIEDAMGARRLLQEKAYFINSDSNQQAKIVDGNIQGGKAMIHVIDAVLVPEAMLTDFNISTEGLPGVVPGETGVEAPDASASRDVTPAPATTAKSSASKAAAAFLAVPALLAALMF